ncbi:MAG: SGNH/GDSL hydrolase family protein [Syntrophobacteraceae bacterium]
MIAWITPERSFRILLVLLSLTVAFAVCEAALRMLYPKSDIFPAEPEKDPILGHRILPNQSGHDGKGFRNDSDKGPFPVVCIGDSFIYGNNVPRRNAIPQQLGRLLKRPVYNMGIGGYGPLQYYHLIDEAKRAGAQDIVIAFYLGNDITDAFSISVRLEYWQFLRQASNRDMSPLDFKPCPVPCEMRDPVYWEPDLLTIRLKSKDSWIWRIHSFLRLHSVFYAMTYEYAVKPGIRTVFEKGKHRAQPGVFHSNSVDIFFRPSISLSALNMRNEQVRSGLQVIGSLIKLMSQKYGKKNDLLFVLIPTKENVYFNYFKQKQVTIPAEYECQVHYERLIAGWIGNELSANGFKYLDALEEMEKAALGGAVLYPNSSDDHPNIRGYEIIADLIYQELKEGSQRVGNNTWERLVPECR